MNMFGCPCIHLCPWVLVTCVFYLFYSHVQYSLACLVVFCVCHHLTGYGLDFWGKFLSQPYAVWASLFHLLLVYCTVKTCTISTWPWMHSPPSQSWWHHQNASSGRHRTQGASFSVQATSFPFIWGDFDLFYWETFWYSEKAVIIGLSSLTQDIQCNLYRSVVLQSCILCKNRRAVSGFLPIGGAGR